MNLNPPGTGMEDRKQRINSELLLFVPGTVVFDKIGTKGREKYELKENIDRLKNGFLAHKYVISISRRKTRSCSKLL